MEKLGNIDQLKKTFLDLVDDAFNLRAKNSDLKPVFSEVPTAMKTFATNVTNKVSQLRSKLTFDFLDGKMNLRSGGLDDKDENKNMITMSQWVVSAMRHIIDVVEQQGEIITVHTEVLAKPDEVRGSLTLIWSSD